MSTTVAKIATVPAPVGGLNARDSLAAMDEKDAISMINLWPQPYGVSVRKGFKAHSPPLLAPIDTLAQWVSASNTAKLYAWAGSSMYEVTAPGDEETPVVTGLSGSVWQTTMMGNTAGNFLIALNGLDDGIHVGPTGTVGRIVSGTGPLKWDSVNPAICVQPVIHIGRLWVVEKNSTRGWYWPTGAVEGVSLSFDFGPLFPRGGSLQMLGTWTMDDGNGAEDHLVAVSSRGDIAVYAGTDPSDDVTWALVGQYYAGAPVSGRRFLTKMAGDMILVTQRGVVSMSQLLVSTKVNGEATLLKSDKIQFLMSELVGSFSALFGWQMFYCPKYNMLLTNVPTTATTGSEQLAVNEVTSAEPWTRFQGMNANTWCLFNEEPYFGGPDGVVYQAWTGGLDDADLDGVGGSDIKSVCQQAYTQFSSSPTQKQVGMYRMNITYDLPFGIASKIVYDYETPQAPIAPPPTSASSGALWDTALWDIDYWGGGMSVSRDWRQASGLGVVASPIESMQTQGSVLWVSTDYSYRSGGLL